MSVFPWKRRKKRICVLGLDGTPHSLLEKLIGNGVMPELAGACRVRLPRSDSREVSLVRCHASVAMVWLYPT